MIPDTPYVCTGTTKGRSRVAILFKHAFNKPRQFINLRILQKIRETIEKNHILKLLLLDCITKSLICAL